MARFVVAVPAALLPRRVWPRLRDHVPVEAAVIPSAIATFLGSAFVGIPVYFDYLAVNGGTPFAFFTFLATPEGVALAYAGTSSMFRAWAAMADDRHGDPLLTLCDAAEHRIAQRLRGAQARRLRREVVGTEAPDRVLPGRAAGFPEATYVVVASHQKPDWDEGTYVETAAGWFRIGAPAHRDTPSGLRTLYPLFDAGELDVVRRHVRYDLPPART